MDGASGAGGSDRSVLISTLVLARVLIPHDFGIVAMAMSFVALLEMFGAFGFDVALIQKADDRKSLLGYRLDARGHRSASVSRAP